MPANHPHTEIVARKGLVTALKAQPPQTVIQRRCAVIAERMFRSPGKHNVFGKFDSIVLSRLVTH